MVKTDTKDGYSRSGRVFPQLSGVLDFPRVLSKAAARAMQRGLICLRVPIHLVRI